MPDTLTTIVHTQDGFSAFTRIHTELAQVTIDERGYLIVQDYTDPIRTEIPPYSATIPPYPAGG